MPKAAWAFGSSGVLACEHSPPGLRRSATCARSPERLPQAQGHLQVEADVLGRLGTSKFRTGASSAAGGTDLVRVRALRGRRRSTSGATLALEPSFGLSADDGLTRPKLGAKSGQRRKVLAHVGQSGLELKQHRPLLLARLLSKSGLFEPQLALVEVISLEHSQGG